ncbi:MAG: arginine--tRNA ligase [Patescibacteria group bacterium]
MSGMDKLENKIEDLIFKNFKDIPKDFIFEFNLPPSEEMGDLSLACFSLAKILNEPSNVIADKITEKLKADGLIESAKAIGPYVNFKFNSGIFINTVIKEILEKKQDISSLKVKPKNKYIIEFSAPNTNKPLHLGHLRNTLLGNAMNNLFIKNGIKSVKLNLINDRGIHICKSMIAYQKWGENKTPETENKKGDHFVGDYYILFEQEAKENPSLFREVQEMLKKWEQGDQETIQLWQKMNHWAISGIEETYHKINVSFDKVYYESEIYKIGKDIVLKALKKGLCEKLPDGAVEINLESYGLGKKILIRADGTSVYVTQDIGLAKLKYNDFKPAKSIYVVASEQDYHFKVLFKILEIFGFPWAKNYEHFSYGMVNLPNGKMKSREGTVVEVDDIVAEMESLVKGEILKRNPNISPIDLSQRSKVIALSALKFFFLKFTPAQEIKFNPQESIAFEGATGTYLLYAYARIQSVIRKAFIDKTDIKEIDLINLQENEERELVKNLFIFRKILRESMVEYNPAILANYLIKLAQLFNVFYHKHQILDTDNEKLSRSRLFLIMAVSWIIKNGLDVLGIETVNEM